VTSTRSKATAATVLLVAAVVAASSAWALASQATPDLSRSGSPATAEQPASEPDSGRSSSAGTSENTAGTTTDLVPKRLEIPAIDVDAPVTATGVTANGDAEIPADGDVVGWYEFGSSPVASRGSAVLIGHRDTNAEGPGALFDLDLVSVGDEMRVRVGARTLDYRVTSVRSVAKAGLPSSLFRRGGPPQLVVITCGGAYLPDAGGYQENLFAVAEPTGS
jgi:LPXTG-site transpeptidase (sortase) family protein